MKPAMAKIMTVFIAFDAIVNGSLEMNDELIVSEKAWRKGGREPFLNLVPGFL